MQKCLYCGKRTKGRRIYCNTTHRVYYHRAIQQELSQDNSSKTILSICDHSGNWSRPYNEAGYQVVQIDLDLNGLDIRLMEYCDKNIHGILAAPPCTHLSSSGAVHWKKKGDIALLEAMSVVDACLRAVAIYKPRFWALENPVGRLSRYLCKPRLIFNPSDYGTPYTKTTCLWGKFNIPKPRPCPVPSTPTGHHSIDRYWKDQGKRLGKDRARLRSITPPEFSHAFFTANP